MIQQINTIHDVITFVELIAIEVNDGNPFEELRRHHRYTREEAEIRNNLMDRCFDVCAGQSLNFKSLMLVLFEEALNNPG